MMLISVKVVIHKGEDNPCGLFGVETIEDNRKDFLSVILYSHFSLIHNDVSHIVSANCLGSPDIHV